MYLSLPTSIVQVFFIFAGESFPMIGIASFFPSCTCCVFSVSRLRVFFFFFLCSYCMVLPCNMVVTVFWLVIKAFVVAVQKKCVPV